MYALRARPAVRYFRLGALGDIVADLSNAIARFEGFNLPNSPAARNNNPGNLRAGPGMVGTDAAGYAIFPDLTTGWNALYSQVSTNISRGLSLQTFFAGQRDAAGQVIPGGYAGYAPSADRNNPTNYANTVAGWIGIDPAAPLSSYLGSPAPGAAAPASSPAVDLSALVPGVAAGFSLDSISPVAALAGVVGAIAVVLLVTQ